MQMNAFHFKRNSQSEDLVPLWVQVLVDCVRLQAIVAQLHHAERVTLPCKAPKQPHIKMFVISNKYKMELIFNVGTDIYNISVKLQLKQLFLSTQ